jgi:hypothetical protein
VQRRPAPATTLIAPAEHAFDFAVDSPAETPPQPAVQVAAVTIAPARSRPSLARLSARDEAVLPLPKPGLVGQPGAGPVSTTAVARVAERPPPQPVASTPPVLPDGAISRKPADDPPSLDLTARNRPTLGQSRRLGLGAPMAALPKTAVTPSSAAVPPLTDVLKSKPVVATPDPARELRRTESVQRRPVEESVAPAVPTLAQPTVAVVAATHTPAQQPTRPVTPSRPGAASPRPPAPTSAPLLSARPIGPRVQRAPIRGATHVQRRAGAETDALPAAAPQAVRVHRGANAAEMSQALEAKAFTHNGEVYLPPSAGPLGSSTARSLLAHELTHVAQQRQYGSRLPHETSAVGQRLEAAAVAAERRAQLPLAMPPDQSSPDAPTATADATSSAQRSPASGHSHASDETTTIMLPGAQRAPADSRTSDVSADSPGPRREPRKPTERELEELATQLYGRISRRLRRELLVDRERAGLMVDLT